MRAVEIIRKKRDGEPLSTEEIGWFVQQYTADEIPDYQAAAFCMAVYLNGMSRQETVDFTLAVAESGDQLYLHDVIPMSVDKHSSGGVGDKTSLVVLPLVAACGVPVAKMSGRGLGFSGGTLDKMEAISGWSPEMTIEQFKTQVEQISLVLAGQSADLAPADGKLYALRDVTATVSSIPLIACSIMSKKLAAGADAIVLDVKVGSGAFMKTVEEARELAQLMVQIGKDAGRETVAVLSDMNQPLGHAVGNALEVQEAIATLRGDEDIPADFWTHCATIAGHMLILAGQADTLTGANVLLHQARNSGRALAKFRAMVTAQGGDGSQVDQPNILPQAPFIQEVYAPREGYIAAIDTAGVGLAAMRLGAGRAKKGDLIDPAVGVTMPVKIGDQLMEGDLLCTVHARTEEALTAAISELQATISWSDKAVTPPPHFHGTITA